MKQKHKDRLKPLEDLFIKLDELIYKPGTTYDEKMAHRVKLLKAANKCTTTNCGHLMYDAAQYIKSELTGMIESHKRYKKATKSRVKR